MWGSFSDRALVNRGASRVLDLLGMSSYLWRFKHNFLHHQNPNVNGLDDDVEASPFLRLHPGQKQRSWHRFQHLYCWPLYSLVTLRWALYSDFAEVFSGRIGAYEYPRMDRKEACYFWSAKLQFVSWALVLPAAIHGVPRGLFFFLVLIGTATFFFRFRGLSFPDVPIVIFPRLVFLSPFPIN